MKVQFEFSAIDLADAARRSAGRSQAVRNWHWYTRAAWAALISVALFFALDAPLIAKAVYTSAIFITLVVIYPRIWRSSGLGATLQYYREQLGGDGPFMCEVEIDAQGVTSMQCGAQTKRGWSAVKEILNTPGAVEFVFSGGGNLVVRDRAFHTPQQRAEFLEEAHRFMTARAS
jgi:hypothetical protein